jgi:X-X-X-Leu-X-X-Gly heptad repeat protein
MFAVVNPSLNLQSGGMPLGWLGSGRSVLVGAGSGTVVHAGMCMVVVEGMVPLVGGFPGPKTGCAEIGRVGELVDRVEQLVDGVGQLVDRVECLGDACSVCSDVVVV